MRTFVIEKVRYLAFSFEEVVVSRGSLAANKWAVGVETLSASYLWLDSAYCSIYRRSNIKSVMEIFGAVSVWVNFPVESFLTNRFIHLQGFVLVKHVYSWILYTTLITITKSEQYCICNGLCTDCCKRSSSFPESRPHLTIPFYNLSAELRNPQLTSIKIHLRYQRNQN